MPLTGNIPGCLGNLVTQKNRADIHIKFFSNHLESSSTPFCCSDFTFCLYFNLGTDRMPLRAIFSVHLLVIYF